MLKMMVVNIGGGVGGGGGVVFFIGVLMLWCCDLKIDLNEIVMMICCFRLLGLVFFFRVVWVGNGKGMVL